MTSNYVKRKRVTSHDHHNSANLRSELRSDRATETSCANFLPEANTVDSSALAAGTSWPMAPRVAPAPHVGWMRRSVFFMSNVSMNIFPATKEIILFCSQEF
jgi:hypothetical protein